MDGLIIKNGRLVNDRPIGETGIAEMARLRKSVVRSGKINMIADGISLCEAKKSLYGRWFILVCWLEGGDVGPPFFVLYVDNRH